MDLAAAGVAGNATCLLNGSFTTSKVDPGDMDLVVEVDVAILMNSVAVQALLAGSASKPRYSCDAYVVPVFPPTDPQYTTVTEHLRAYWRKWFGQDRAGLKKGRVWTCVGGFR
ncbi:MAG TPA: hypothetical protein VH062_01405 [Polyangiaceae bacterium]|nr:hypothetical protein [Polyangiaceae bacterium]